MMQKKSVQVAIAALAVWVVLMTAAAVYLLLTRGAGGPAKSGSVGAPVLAPSPQGGIVTDVPPGIPSPDMGTAAAPEPLPPVVVNPRSAQGLQRVDFNPSIGDVYKLHYDHESGQLFMATIEPDGVRAVWRLSSDLQLKRVLLGSSRQGEVFLQADSSGVLYAGFADPGNLFRSDDLGDTWELVEGKIDGAFWAIADDGQGTLWGALHAYNKALLYRSTDDGHTWEVWKDFQEIFPELAVTYREGDDRFKLRHLHGVAYYFGRLFVGVGDVARFTVVSEDGGETWREIWSEGFTAQVRKVDSTGVLFGPDRLQTHGIALYDFVADRTSEVWSPIPYGYSGYTYSMMQMDGVYYAAFHTETNEVAEFSGKSGIIVSPDSLRWYPFLDFDPLTNWARTDIYMAPGRVVNGTVSLNGYVTLNGALYMFEPPFGRWFDVHRAFGE